MLEKLQKHCPKGYKVEEQDGVFVVSVTLRSQFGIPADEGDDKYIKKCLDDAICALKRAIELDAWNRKLED